jgi:hypothetical protein
MFGPMLLSEGVNRVFGNLDRVFADTIMQLFLSLRLLSPVGAPG